MRAGFGTLRALVAGAGLGFAILATMPASFAQTAPAAGPPPAATGAPPLEGCGIGCRFLHNLFGVPAGSETQASVEPKDESPRRARRPAGEPADEGRSRAKAAEPARPKTGTAPRREPSPEDVEQTASLSPEPADIVLVARPDGTHGAIAEDLAEALAPDVTVRTMPGPGGPLHDVLSLPGADATIVSSLSLARGAALADRLVYIAKLFTEELHAVAAPGIARLEDLEGKPVHLGSPGSDGELAAKTFLESRGITVAPAAGTLTSALAGLSEGRIAAAFILAPRPAAPLAGLGGGLRLLPLAFRSTDADFHPAAFSAADYPELVPQGGRVETVSLDAVLVAPRWRENTPRQEELAAFTARFFDRFAALSGAGRHPKWGETNLAATVDGLRRLRSAQQWIGGRLKGRDASLAAPVREASGMGAMR